MGSATKVLKEAATEPAEVGVLFELENLAVKGRWVLHGVLERVLEKHDVLLTRAVFDRHCLHASAIDSLQHILQQFGRKRLLAGKIGAEINGELLAVLSDGVVSLNNGLKRLLEAAARRGIPVGALTCLEPGVAQALIRNLDIARFGVKPLCSADCERGFPTADGWLRLARAISVAPPRCVVLATSSRAVRAALMAHMSCIGVPDEYTAGEDFSGADSVASAMNEGLIDEFLRLLKAR